MLIVMIAAFLVLAVGIFAFVSGLDQRNEQARVMRDRLSALDRAMQRHQSPELALLRDELLSTVPALNRVLKTSKAAVALQNYLSQAGIRMLAGKFLLISASLGVIVCFLVTRLLPSVALGLSALAAGAYIPFLVVQIQRTRRFHQFEALMPDAIDLLARSVRAGHAFNASLELIANEMAEPLSSEFRKVYEEQKFGLPIRDSLLNLTERVPLVDLKFFVVAVLLQRDTGGNLAEVLDKLSYIIRERFKILRQVRVYTAQGRMSMLILMALPPGMAVLMTFMAPEFIRRLVTDPIGHQLIFAGVVMQTIGFLLIRKIIHIRV